MHTKDLLVLFLLLSHFGENVDGTGTSWTKHVVDGAFDGANSVFSADMNNNGYMDILGTALSAEEISWWENIDGTGTNWTKHVLDGAYDGAYSVYAEDLNNDNYIDILSTKHDDKIYWWKVTGFPETGTLESSILEIPLDVDTLVSWNTIDWTCAEPSGTEVFFQVRGSDNSSDMGEWSDTIFVSGTSIETCLDQTDRYIQYRAILQTTDSGETPELEQVWIYYDCFTETADDCINQVESYSLNPVSPNPASGSVSVSFAIPVAGTVNISLFDVSGRIVTSPASGEFSRGTHSVLIDNLPAGNYMCLMECGDFRATEKMIIVE